MEPATAYSALDAYKPKLHLQRTLSQIYFTCEISVESSLTELGAQFTLLLLTKMADLTYQFYKSEWGCLTWVNGKK